MPISLKNPAKPKNEHIHWLYTVVYNCICSFPLYIGLYTQLIQPNLALQTPVLIFGPIFTALKSYISVYFCIQAVIKKN